MRRIGGVDVYERLEELVEPGHTALLVVDMQNDFCHPDGHFARHGRDTTRTLALAPPISRFITHARAAGVPVVFTRQTTLAAGASDSPAWLYFKTRDGKSPDYTIEGTWGAAFVDDLDVRADDPIVEKHRPSAFYQTSLDALLRDRGVETVIVAGCLTQGCVQATVTDASYHDYYAVVVEDLVASTSAELHENALRFLRSRYDVVPSELIRESWSRRS